MTKILITRPQPDADALAALLREKNFEPVVDPLFTCVFSTTPPQAKNYQAVLATSRNALRALASLGIAATYLTLPLFAVGAETEKEALKCGFTQTHAAEHSASSLASLVMQYCQPDAGPLLYLTGTPHKAELETALREAGYQIEAWEGYDMQPAAAFQNETMRALLGEEIETVLLFSERASGHFLKLTRHLPAQTLRNINFFCLSEQVAAPLLQKGLNAHIADKAVLHALLDGLDDKNH
ncbi:MAG: uroporphyrinogen-III synthase [Pseudomonadota bacterium]